MAYLGMPVIVQRMVARVLSADGRSMIVLTHLDAIPPNVARDCFARPEIVSTMRREGVSLLATYRGTPPDPLRRAFPRVFHVEGPPRGPWPSARVTAEEGHHPTCAVLPSATVTEWVAHLRSGRDQGPPGSVRRSTPTLPGRDRS